jgi:hypothetical protein
VIHGGRAPAAGHRPTAGAERAVYVYGVIRRTAPGGLTGSGVGSRPAPLRLVEGRTLSAVVSDVPPTWRAAGRADVERHDRVLAELMDRETVVPMRFGIVMASDDDVRDRLLERHAGTLAALLERLDGRVQMSVKAYYLEEALLREVLRRHPELKRRSDALEGLPLAASQPERIALGRDVAAAVEEQRALDERTLAEPLAAVADDIRVEPPVSDRQVAAIQLLVGADERPRLDAAVRRLADEHGSRFGLRYVGPLPPYSFSVVALDEGR